MFWVEIGVERPIYGQHRAYGGTVLYSRTPSFQTDRTCTVLYGVLRYSTIIIVKKAEVRRILTSLIIIRHAYLTPSVHPNACAHPKQWSITTFTFQPKKIPNLNNHN